MNRRHALGAVALALTGCGGGGTSPASPERLAGGQGPSITPTQPNMTKIACYGDSTMYGSVVNNGVVSQSAFNVPATLQSLLPAHTVENHGIPGSNTSEWLYGNTALITQSWANRMANTDAGVVLINTGINDSFLTNFTLQDYLYCYGQFWAIAQAHGKTMVFVTPNPIDDVHNTQLWDLQHALKASAAGWGVPVIDQYNLIVAACPQWARLLCDKIHPGDDLYRFMGNVAFLGLQGIV